MPARAMAYRWSKFSEAAKAVAEDGSRLIAQSKFQEFSPFFSTLLDHYLGS
jgi:hypothetical protein